MGLPAVEKFGSHAGEPGNRDGVHQEAAEKVANVGVTVEERPFRAA